MGAGAGLSDWSDMRGVYERAVCYAMGCFALLGYLGFVLGYISCVLLYY